MVGQVDCVHAPILARVQVIKVGGYKSALMIVFVIVICGGGESSKTSGITREALYKALRHKREADFCMTPPYVHPKHSH